MKKSYIVRGLVLTLGEEIKHAEEKLGKVYKCVDQSGESKLLHVTDVSSANGMLSKFYLMETNFHVRAGNKRVEDGEGESLHSQSVGNRLSQQFRRVHCIPSHRTMSR
eukprot:TRINITY_DN1802_c0_g2_i2.p1 TRINITY_DN1802_c0_g2~~TRINITY_DN1802_c0_g2_i2.p1  ORF type:complete len:108 (+),score=13.31 TRINITY_DN1802_c0_g2_i2:88-411(+)